jgi:hypothetical protein
MIYTPHPARCGRPRTLDMGDDDPRLPRTWPRRLSQEEQSAPRLICPSIIPRLPFAGVCEFTNAFFWLAATLPALGKCLLICGGFLDVVLSDAAKDLFLVAN